MMRSHNPLHHKSHTGFVIINGSSKDERTAEWDWLTQRNQLRSAGQQQQNAQPRLSYVEKKRILTGLNYTRPSTNFKIRTGFNLNERKRAVSTASQASLGSQRKTQPFLYINSTDEQSEIPALNFGIDMPQLAKSIQEAQSKGNRLVGVISVRRLGLRFKFNHTFVEYCSTCKPTHDHELKQFGISVKENMKEYIRTEKELYFFSTKGVPLHSYKDISRMKLKVILVDSSPRLQYSSQLFQKVDSLGDRIQQVLSQQERIILSFNPQEALVKQKRETDIPEQEQYDHQRIKNVKEYVERLSQDPGYQISQREDPQNELISWYNEKYTKLQQKNSKPSDKNLLFETKNHYPKQILNKKLLAKAGERVQKLPITNNRHKYIPMRVDLMMQQVKRQNPKEKSKRDYLLEAPVTKKDMMVQLDRKNSLLSTQNIPYLIQKYGLNRFQLYNLYNLYKSFEKIAVMRSSNKEASTSIKEQGIDRETFEVGLKGLDMNPGEQLIKGICYFGDYISWEQFIKIISISLRKTPEEKLTAILKGISSFDSGYLSRHQISLMIGNSLYKLFDHEEPQLKDYFTSMAMAQFDPQGRGQASVETMKQKVLGKGSDNMNMVSFLILNT